MAVAVEPKTRGDEEKMATALRRLGEEDPTLQLSRDEQTGELIVHGLSQMHVEVTVERVRRRFGVEMVTHPPRVPYLEAIAAGPGLRAGTRSRRVDADSSATATSSSSRCPGTRATCSRTRSSAA